MHWQIRNPLPDPLMRSSLIEIQDIGASGSGGDASHGRSGNDPNILASHFGRKRSQIAFALRGFGMAFEAL